MPKGIYVRGENSKYENSRGDIVSVFWKRVNKDGPIIIPKLGKCWIWTGALYPNDYGQFRNQRAHRFVYELVFGEIPDEGLICHHCDNPPCVNPSHVFLGTPKSNMLDKCKKSRQTKGEDQVHAKLTEELVKHGRILFANGMTVREIAAELGTSVTHYNLLKAIKRHTWKHVS